MTGDDWLEGAYDHVEPGPTHDLSEVHWARCGACGTLLFHRDDWVDELPACPHILGRTYLGNYVEWNEAYRPALEGRALLCDGPWGPHDIHSGEVGLGAPGFPPDAVQYIIHNGHDETVYYLTSEVLQWEPLSGEHS